MDFRVGQIVLSKAGRDKGKFLAVVALSDEGIFVCDGRERPLENPKRKNPKHLSATGMVLEREEMAGNKALKKALALKMVLTDLTDTQREA